MVDDQHAFARLQGLAGDYELATPVAGSPTVIYRSIARGTAITELWTWPSGAQELTVFFLDHGALRATHYCHSGVQSTMTLQRTGGDGTLSFRLTAATNLIDPAQAHNTAFSYRFDGNDRIVRTEEWTAHGRVETSQDELRRRDAGQDP